MTSLAILKANSEMRISALEFALRYISSKSTQHQISEALNRFKEAAIKYQTLVEAKDGQVPGK